MSRPDGAHGFAGQLADVAVWLASRAMHFEGAAAKLAGQVFGHLVADAIDGAENQKQCVAA